VVWLPTCPAPIDHLRQYGLIDVALDPFPNGGCTTSCEALWMGVPVISLCGTHYVSRMSTAVLQGAQLSEWIARDAEHYLQLAQQASEQLTAIRANRRALRAHLQASPLGDAQDLAQQLWQCLEQLA
jgi:predicted O-linked N-acetylglucosamine transferase (SPINDLY family)